MVGALCSVCQNVSCSMHKLCHQWKYHRPATVYWMFACRSTHPMSSSRRIIITGFSSSCCTTPDTVASTVRNHNYYFNLKFFFFARHSKWMDENTALVPSTISDSTAKWWWRRYRVGRPFVRPTISLMQSAERLKSASRIFNFDWHQTRE